jgi:hypothetical protein
MSGLGSFDRTGSISGGLKAAALTYGGGQIARGIGGAGFQTGFNPFDAASLGQSASSFIGVPYSSPLEHNRITIRTISLMQVAQR